MLIKRLLERNSLTIAIIFTIFITIVSLISINGVHIIKVSNSDKFGHFIAYFFLSFSWLYALRNFPRKKFKEHLIVFLLISYGIIIEVLQGVLTSYRQADIYDIIANSAGVIFASIIFGKLSKIL